MSTIRLISPVTPSLPYDCTLCHYVTHHVTADHNVATSTIRRCRKHEEKPYPPFPATPFLGRNLKASVLGALDKLHITNTPAAAKIVAEDTARMLESIKRPDFAGLKQELNEAQVEQEDDDDVIYLGQNVKGGCGGDDSELFWWEVADRKVKKENEQDENKETEEMRGTIQRNACSIKDVI
ncbi:hypothetical protein K440DRAFT_672075 [Wilcoxina mikolae CBS 423.85]|nr:hypothetical protein K440DRAFT_672075 [Wilcoxina mikolae CBS 423.85]